MAGSPAIPDGPEYDSLRLLRAKYLVPEQPADPTRRRMPALTAGEKEALAVTALAVRLAGASKAKRRRFKVSAKITKLHNGERLLKQRYLALRSALRDLAEYSPHIGRTRNQCALHCPSCNATKALVEDAAHGRVVDDRPRGSGDGC